MTKTEAQKRASKAWNEKNQDKVRHSRRKTTAKSFIRLHATKEDIEEIRELCDKVMTEKFS